MNADVAAPPAELSQAARLQADLDQCDRAPIHQPGQVQDFGFLVGVSADWLIARVSENAPRWLGRPVAALLGAPLAEVFDQAAIHRIRGRLQVLRGGRTDGAERIFGLALRGDGPRFDLALHWSGETVIIEAEPAAEAAFDALGVVRGTVLRLQQAQGIEGLCQEAARQMAVLTGFDRAMVYRFAPDGSGEVIAESAAPGMQPFLGLRYPASDIPAPARALYERNLLRIIADVGAAAVPVAPTLDPGGAALDLSLSVLRAVAPVHIEYLKNMGVAASLSVSILRDGKLWGLFACHHRTPRHLPLERRTAAEMLGQMFAWLLDGRERAAELAQEERARRLHGQLMSAMGAGGTTFDAVTGFLGELDGFIDCGGMALWVEDRATLHGITPPAERLAGLVRFLNRNAASRPFASHAIGALYDGGAALLPQAAGVLAIPISRTPRDYLLLFRPEAARTVRWGGDPNHATHRENGRVSPRKSFAAWQESVAGQSLPWTATDLRMAESLRITLLEIILRLTDGAEKVRRSAQERQELLIAELNHRVRNILGLIGGLVAQSAAGATTPEAFVGVIGGRVQALARAHDQITIKNWEPAPLRELIALEAAAYLGTKADRIRLEGPAVLLQPQAYSTLALVVHELMTNSAKYGALSDSRGEVRVGWNVDAAGGLALRWQEAGGPPVQPPGRRGFGSTIIERTIPYELKGKAELRYEPAGLAARFAVPATFVELVAGQPRGSEGAQAAPCAPARLLSGNVLLVEDNMIIALDAQGMLQKLGADRVDTAASVRQALRLIEREQPSFALLDVNLGQETSMPVAERLASLGVPFVFASGYGDSLKLAPELAAVPVVSKPFTGALLGAALARVVAGRG